MLSDCLIWGFDTFWFEDWLDAHQFEIVLIEAGLCKGGMKLKYLSADIQTSPMQKMFIVTLKQIWRNWPI